MDERAARAAVGSSLTSDERLYAEVRRDDDGEEEDDDAEMDDADNDDGVDDDYGVDDGDPDADDSMDDDDDVDTVDESDESDGDDRYSSLDSDPKRRKLRESVAVAGGDMAAFDDATIVIESVLRTAGNTAGSVDHYYTVNGKRLRSRTDVARIFGVNLPKSGKNGGGGRRKTLESLPSDFTAGAFRHNCARPKKFRIGIKKTYGLVAFCCGGGASAMAVSRALGVAVLGAFDEDASKINFARVNLGAEVAKLMTLQKSNILAQIGDAVVALWDGPCTFACDGGKPETRGFNAPTSLTTRRCLPLLMKPSSPLKVLMAENTRRAMLSRTFGDGLFGPAKLFGFVVVVVELAACESMSLPNPYIKKNAHALTLWIGDRDPAKVAAHALALAKSFKRRRMPPCLDKVLDPDFSAGALFVKADESGWKKDGWRCSSGVLNNITTERRLMTLRRGPVHATLLSRLNGPTPGARAAAKRHGGFARWVDKKANLPLLDKRGNPLCAGPRIRELLRAMGHFEDFVVPLDATVTELARVMSEAHTQGVLYDFYRHMAPAIDAAVAAGPARTVTPRNGLLVDATAGQLYKKAHGHRFA